MRIAGRRPGKQLTPMDFVLIFFAGGLTLTTVVGDDRSVTNALAQILTIAVAHYSLTILRQIWPRVGEWVDGTPLVLLAAGKWHVETMLNMRVTDDDVMAMARDNDVKTLDQIKYAVLERNGEISIIPKKDEQAG
jgi:uncharacterized membrane protein YcaP (DUF421 family)